MINLDGIDVFVKVIQAGSFTRAAQLLNMPITTVSGKVAALEKRLGITLLHRTTRKLHLTENGEAFFKRCVKALEEIAAGENELSTSKQDLEGTLKISASLDVGQTLLPPLVSGFLKQHPKLQIELILTNRLVDLVGEGIDLAVRIGKLKDSTLIAKKFIEPTSYLWASPSYLKKYGVPQNPKQLKEHKFVRFFHDDKKVKLIKAQQAVEIDVVGPIVVDDMNALKAFVLAGDGIGMIPSFICGDEEAQGKLVRVLPTWSRGNILLSFVYPPQRFVSPKVRTFIEWAEKNHRS